MKRNTYVVPQIETVAMKVEKGIMAGSGKSTVDDPNNNKDNNAPSANFGFGDDIFADNSWDWDDEDSFE